MTDHGDWFDAPRALPEDHRNVAPRRDRAASPPMPGPNHAKKMCGELVVSADWFSDPGAGGDLDDDLDDATDLEVPPLSPAAPTCGGPDRWPENVEYTDGVQDCDESLSRLPLELRKQLLYRSFVEVRIIEDPEHPCYGQRGVFATVEIPYNTVLFPYSGKLRVSLRDEPNPSEFTVVAWDHGEYVFEIDASEAGNESRFINDPRNVPGASGANVVFSHPPEKKTGVFTVIHVRTRRGIKGGEEILLHYGNDFFEEQDDD